MPLYDYDCANCGERFEILRGVHADPPGACPLCGGGPLKKAFTTPAIHFKGSGWAKKERRAASSAGHSKPSVDTATAKHGGSTATESASPTKDGSTPSGDNGSAGSREGSKSSGSAKAVASGSDSGGSSSPTSKAG